MLVTVRTSREALESECARLSRLVGKRQSSLWTATKAELVELARKELGWTQAQCEKETVTSLRERIRSVRSVVNFQADPLNKLPVGLDKMKVEELKTELLMRDLPEPDKSTRAQMICLIRDDVATRLTLTTEAAPSTKSSSSTGPQAKQVSFEDLDYEMPEATNSRRKRG